MLKRLCLILAIVLLIPVNAYGEELNISAESYCVIDAKTNCVLLEQDANNSRSMASTTKIMTCLLACESGMIFDDVVITADMLDGAIGSLIYLNVGDVISFKDLIVGAMLASGNDAANAIAVSVGGSVEQFVDLMNNRAEKIGMKNTVFVTPSGLDEGNHHSTAYDMAILTEEALKNSTFTEICSKSKADITINGEKQTIYNHNKLLSNKACLGVKTGFTEKAGRCLVSAFDYHGNTIIIVTLSAPDDWNDHSKLLSRAKKKYKHKRNKININIPLVGSDKDFVKCKAEYDFYALNNIKTEKYYYPFVYSPASIGETVGYVKLYDNDIFIKTVDIIVEEDV